MLLKVDRNCMCQFFGHAHGLQTSPAGGEEAREARQFILREIPHSYKISMTGFVLPMNHLQSTMAHPTVRYGPKVTLS
jgi:hypothetical protein